VLANRSAKQELSPERGAGSVSSRSGAQSDQRLRRCLPVLGPLGGIHHDPIVSVSPAAVELAEEPCMTVLRRTCLDGSWHVLDGRPQRKRAFSEGLKETENPRVGGSIPPLGTSSEGLRDPAPSSSPSCRPSERSVRQPAGRAR